MTSPDYGELVKRLRSRCENVYDYATQGAEWQQDALCVQAADAIEQQAGLLSARDQQITVQAEKIAMFMRELAACEGALRNSGNMVRDLNAEVLRLRKKYDRLCFELNSRGIFLPGEPDTRGTGYAGEVGCG